MLKIILLSIIVFTGPLKSIANDEVGSFWRAKNTSVDNKPVVVGDVFKTNQLIMTGNSSRSKAELSIKDNSRYILYKNSSIIFENFEMTGRACKGMKVTLTRGKIRGTSGSCGDGKTNIITAVATATAWGTDYEMLYLGKDDLRGEYKNIAPGFYQMVNEGKVLVKNKRGGLLVNPGEAGFVSIHGEAPIIIPMPEFFTNIKKPVKEEKKAEGGDGVKNEKEKKKEDGIGFIQVGTVELVAEENLGGAYRSFLYMDTSEVARVETKLLDTEVVNEIISVNKINYETQYITDTNGVVVEKNTAYYNRETYQDTTYTDKLLYIEKISLVAAEETWQIIEGTEQIIEGETIGGEYTDVEIYNYDAYEPPYYVATGISERKHYQKKVFTEYKKVVSTWSKMHLDSEGVKTDEEFKDVDVTVHFENDTRPSLEGERGDYLFTEYNGIETALKDFIAEVVRPTFGSVENFKIIGKYSSNFNKMVSTDGGTITPRSANIYDDLFDPIKNQDQDIEIKLTLNDSDISKSVIIVPKDTRNQYGSFVAVGSFFNYKPYFVINAGNPTSTNTGNTSQFTEAVNAGGYSSAYQNFAGQDYILDGGDDERMGKEINQGSSTIYLGSRSNINHSSLEMYIYENKAGTTAGLLGTDENAKMLLPKYGTINYKIAEKSDILISRDGAEGLIDENYELTDVELGINFNNNKVNTKLAVSNGTTKIWSNISNGGLSIESDLEIDTVNNSPTGRFSGGSMPKGSSNVFNPGDQQEYQNITQAYESGGDLVQGDILFNGTTMGNKGSHVGLGYSMLFDADTVTSGTVLLRAETGSDRNTGGAGSLIMLNTLDNNTKMTAETPSDSVDGEQNWTYFKPVVGIDNNTIELSFVCSERSGTCENSNYIVDNSRGVVDTVEKARVINEGSMSESTVHWGWWSSVDDGGVFGYNDHNTLFMYEQYSEYNGNGMRLPTKGIIDYEVMESSQLLINTADEVGGTGQSNYKLTDDYKLKDAAMEIDFGLINNNLTVSVIIEDVVTKELISSNIGTTTLNKLNGTFYINGGYGLTEYPNSSIRQSGIAKGSFSATGAMMGTNGSHAGMGYKMAIEDIEDVNSTGDTVLGVVLFKAKD